MALHHDLHPRYPMSRHWKVVCGYGRAHRLQECPKVSLRVANQVVYSVRHVAHGQWQDCPLQEEGCSD